MPNFSPRDVVEVIEPCIPRCIYCEFKLNTIAETISTATKEYIWYNNRIRGSVEVRFKKCLICGETSDLWINLDYLTHTKTTNSNLNYLEGF